MKKITLSLLTFLLASVFQAQTFSTGTVQLSSSGLNYTAKLDVTSSLVTVTIIAPSDRWMALGFSNAAVSFMAAGTDIIAFDGTNLTDRTLGGIGVYDLDAVQSWTITSNTVVSGVRTLVGTRALNTGETNDYVFSATATAINLTFARASSATFILQPHSGLNNAGNRPTNLTLGNNIFEIDKFKMFPNPAKNFTIIEFPNYVINGEVNVYDSLGRLIVKQNLTNIDNKLSTNNLKSGTYMIVVRTDYGNATKNLIVE